MKCIWCFQWKFNQCCWCTHVSFGQLSKLCVVSIAKTILTHRLLSINCLKFLLIGNSRKFFRMNHIKLKLFEFIKNLLNIIIFSYYDAMNTEKHPFHHVAPYFIFLWLLQVQTMSQLDCRHWNIWQFDWFLYNTFFFKLRIIFHNTK